MDVADPTSSVRLVDLLDWFSLLRMRCLTTVAIAVVVGFWAFPTQTADVFRHAVSERAAVTTEALQRSSEPALERPAPHPQRTRYPIGLRTYGYTASVPARAEDTALAAVPTRLNERRDRKSERVAALALRPELGAAQGSASASATARSSRSVG
ncbi:MAG: hypothetical protein QOD83_1201 [Solirubrobacteraceae bacterium]|nr:hypothetical protein [Solirubrobacteraceae bacterium]